jgi:hypothetical protein
MTLFKIMKIKITIKDIKKINMEKIFLKFFRKSLFKIKLLIYILLPK